MAGKSPHYPCFNLPPCLSVETLAEFEADRELDQPIELLYRRSGEGNNLNGVLTSIYSVGKVFRLVEEKVTKQELGKQKFGRADRGE